jgi:hypothetical protein
MGRKNMERSIGHARVYLMRSSSNRKEQENREHCEI